MYASDPTSLPPYTAKPYAGDQALYTALRIPADSPADLKAVLWKTHWC